MAAFYQPVTIMCLTEGFKFMGYNDSHDALKTLSDAKF